MPHSACCYKVLSQLTFIYISWKERQENSKYQQNSRPFCLCRFIINSLLVWLNQNSLIRRLWVIRKVSMRFTCYWRRTYIDLSSHFTSSSSSSSSLSYSSSSSSSQSMQQTSLPSSGPLHYDSLSSGGN